ncbi:cysteine--tRNA ligase [Candidatus Saccharibacteria bacterium]|nr:cysteine--tRNA ligase [Candidatus Saccharibacteria bacterium]
MLKLYNTLSRKLEEFRPAGEVVKIYTCGPTVYNYQHIGNFAAFVYWDLLVRCLRLNGHSVRRVLNLTDVGHLVSDGDSGEDKLEKGAAREGRSVWEVADFYISDFLNNYRALELSEPEVLARATDYIEADERAVDLMRERGFVYETQDGVYYDTAKFDGYADFARLDLKGLQAGARVGFSDEKRNASDFAVWKFIQPGEKHAMRWDYLGRPGYPGWHLECSTIIHEELGEPIDIHCGGIDHIPVHHTNEIAQSFAAYGRALARVWLHCNFITIDGEKISKSLGNVYLLSDLAERGFSPMDYKMWVLSGHYQGERNFTFEGLLAAQNRRMGWRERIAECYQKATKPGGKGGSQKVLEAVNNNLNSAEAFAAVDAAALTLEDWKRIDELFGLRLIAETPDVPREVYDLLRDRDAARAERDFAKSDEIRDLLAERGVGVKDTPSGGVWYYL